MKGLAYGHEYLKIYGIYKNCRIRQLYKSSGDFELFSVRHSRMINDLEKEWKITLLERNRSGVRLTSDGMRILPYAKSLCDEYQKLQMQVDDMQGLQSGIIRIGTFSSVATHWLPNIIREFQKDYPGIDYELLLGGLYRNRRMDFNRARGLRFLRLPHQTGVRYDPFGA